MKGSALALAAAATMAAASTVMSSPFGSYPHEVEHKPEPELLPPDHLSVEIGTPHFDPCYKRVGVRFNGVERKGDVQEYCMSEGWIIIRQRNVLGQFKIDSAGRYLLERLEGAVVAYWKDGRPTRRAAPAYVQPPDLSAAHLSAAEAKRLRKAEKLRRLAGHA